MGGDGDFWFIRPSLYISFKNTVVAFTPFFLSLQPNESEILILGKIYSIE